MFRRKQRYSNSNQPNPFRIRHEARRGRIFVGNERKSKQPVYLSHELLNTHLHVIGPTNSGKSRFLLHLYQLLARRPDATVFMLSPKGDLCRAARDWSIKKGMTDRLVLFDPSDPDVSVGYNPLHANGLAPTTHAKAVRESIRAAWGQSSFDETPQLARFLYLCLAAARETGRNLGDALSLLRPNSETRSAVLAEVQDPFTVEALAYFDELPARRQDELASSTLARLEAFVNDPLLNNILTAPESLDFGEVLRERQLCLINLELYRPLRPDDVAILGRLVLNDILAHVFSRGPADRSPVYLVVDEVATFATDDLCSVLDLGRELGCHAVLAHQYLAQLQNEGVTSQLYHSILKSARTRLLFGGLSVDDLERLAPESFIDDFDDMEVKDELTTLELEPIETTRQVVTRGWNESRQVTDTNGVGVANTTTHTTTRSKTKGDQFGEVSTSSSGSSSVVLPSGESVETEIGSSGSSSTHTSIDVENEGESDGDGTTHSRSHSQAIGNSTGRSESAAEVPWHEYRKRRVVSSRTFVTEQEFMTRRIKDTKTLPQASFVLKTPHSPALFMEGPAVEVRPLAPEKLQEAKQQIYSRRYYRRNPTKVISSRPRALIEGDDDWMME